MNVELNARIVEGFRKSRLRVSLRTRTIGSAQRRVCRRHSLKVAERTVHPNVFQPNIGSQEIPRYSVDCDYAARLRRMLDFTRSLASGVE